jgi:hypothetical protein
VCARNSSLICLSTFICSVSFFLFSGVGSACNKNNAFHQIVRPPPRSDLSHPRAVLSRCTCCNTNSLIRHELANATYELVCHELANTTHELAKYTVLRTHAPCIHLGASGPLGPAAISAPDAGNDAASPDWSVASLRAIPQVCVCVCVCVCACVCVCVCVSCQCASLKPKS